MTLDELRGSIVLSDAVSEPKPARLLNLEIGKELLLRHMNNGGVIGVHFDVDCDGFSGGIVLYRALKALLPTVHITTNKERTHGVNGDTAEFVWKNKISLLLVVDSSSRLDYDMGCDVLVLDHHEFDGADFRAVGEYTQVVVSNRHLPVVEPMSGCQVAYEFFRHVYAQMETPMDTRLAQWVGVSLISDVIDVKTERNQFYVREAFESNTGIHPDLRRICTDISSYFKCLYRSFVTYTLAPRINAISRAGFSGSLAYVISDGEPPKLPEWALTKRDSVCGEALARAKRVGGVVFSNLTGIEDAWRYTGIVAAKLSSKTGCSALVFVEDGEDGARGSFRHSISGGDYLAKAKRFLQADGHAAAFGFSGSRLCLKEFIVELSKTPPAVPPVQLASADVVRGGELRDIALWNSRVGSEDEIFITVSPSELTFVRAQGKVGLYRWKNSFEVRLLEKEFPQPPRLFAELQRGASLSLYLK
ncbi:hypothetical protein FACS1894208_00100 [Clostridia bacterium]|nr:hypothetical protein FACS1894208_00100 [Clostridia bacterium]